MQSATSVRSFSRAQACLGAPYVWGGVGPDGYDCSGLVSYALTGAHERLGTTYTFMEWPAVSDPQPGDVCVNWGHTGIYIGNNQMIHSWPTTGVSIANIYTFSSKDKFVGGGLPL
jgi:cell wall-associated NlpC family hydrolase